MNVTINTDASYCPHEGVGGFACYIKSNYGTMTKTGPIKSPEGAHDCELKAIANAIYLLENSRWNNGTIQYIVINSDCKSVFDKIKKNSTHPIGKYIIESIERIKLKARTKTRKRFHTIKHVKGHSEGKDPRSWVNNWCDEQARIAMRNQRKIFYQEKVNSDEPLKFNLTKNEKSRNSFA